jgi:hypothetical protein
LIVHETTLLKAMFANTAFYRPPRGVCENHRFAYYTILARSFGVGLAEVAALSPSSSGERSRAFAATVFFTSLVPLAAVIAGGFAVVMKGYGAGVFVAAVVGAGLSCRCCHSRCGSWALL